MTAVAGSMSAANQSTPTAVVAAGDEETRVLLRGLLRLHHYRVIGEAEGLTRAMEFIQAHHPSVLVTDVNLAEGSSTRLIEESKRSSPDLRVILVTPAARPPPTPEGSVTPDVVLPRPFKIRQFAEALCPPAPSAPP
ncbi:MAG: response regulator [Thermoplasmata archaeon]